jgi:hypothetical protein
MPFLRDGGIDFLGGASRIVGREWLSSQERMVRALPEPKVV